MANGRVLVVGDSETKEKDIMGVIKFLESQGCIGKEDIVTQTKNPESAKEEIRLINPPIGLVVVVKKTLQIREVLLSTELVWWIAENYPKTKIIPIRVIENVDDLQKIKGAIKTPPASPRSWQNN